MYTLQEAHGKAFVCSWGSDSSELIASNFTGKYRFSTVNQTVTPLKTRTMLHRLLPHQAVELQRK